MKRFVFLSILIISGVLFFAERKNFAFGEDPQPVSDSIMLSELKKYSLSLENFGRKEFYSWTTSEQIEELRNGKEFLSRSQSAKGVKSYFDQVLSDSIYNDFATAKILRGQQFAKKRFAWIDGWATVMGWQGENYGNQLLKITLKDSAILIAFLPDLCSNFSTGDKYFSYCDVKGNLLTEEFVMAHQNRIAAVYFIGHRNEGRTSRKLKREHGTMYSESAPKYFTQTIDYREFIICNEQMIDTWESSTDAVLSEIANEKKVLNDLQSYIAQKNIKQEAWSMGNFCWQQPQYPYANIPQNLYTYCLAFPNDFYMLNSNCLSAISTTLTGAINAHKESISHIVK